MQRNKCLIANRLRFAIFRSSPGNRITRANAARKTSRPIDFRIDETIDRAVAQLQLPCN
jgi:hypothetical protein